MASCSRSFSLDSGLLAVVDRLLSGLSPVSEAFFLIGVHGTNGFCITSLYIIIWSSSCEESSSIDFDGVKLISLFSCIYIFSSLIYNSSLLSLSQELIFFWQRLQMGSAD
jgi:hypothetical protein